MKKLLALILCVMLFVSVIPMAAFADDAAASGKTEVDPVKAALAKAIKTKNELADKIAAIYEGYADTLIEKAITERDEAALKILANYDKLADAYVTAASAKFEKETKEINEKIAKEYSDLVTSANKEIEAMIAAISDS